MSKFNITSGPIPSLELEIPSNATIMMNPGAWLGGTPHLKTVTEFYKPANRNRLTAMLMSGEGITMNYVSNLGNKPETIIISDERIGQINAIKPQDLKDGILCAKGAFFAASGKIDVSFKQARSFALAQITKQPVWMQHCHYSGDDSSTTLFLIGPTNTIEVELDKDEPYLLDNNAIFAMSENITLRPYEVDGLKGRYGGGEGRFMTIAMGPGKLWLAPPQFQNDDKGSIIQTIIKTLTPG